jgi:iron(III) transport system permease protein
VGLLCFNPLLPSLLFAFSILELGKRGGLLSWLWTPLESSWLIIMMAQTLRFLPFVLIPVTDVLMRMPAHWTEAARTLGASAPRAYRQVILPQLRAPLAAGSLLIFVQSVNELTLSLLLQPFNYQSLSLRIFSYTGIYMTKEASIWVLLSLVICIYPIATLSRLLDPPIKLGRGEPRA